MEAKDTAMSYDFIYFRGYGIHLPSYAKEHIFEGISQAQAEISFKVGQEQGFGAGVWAGRQEVVEYLKPFTTEAPFAGKELGQFIIYLERPDWRVKLKEWGIGD